MLTAAAPDLLHVVGYLTGATLYAMLLLMVLRAHRADRLMLVTASLGLAWNVGELLAQTLGHFALTAAGSWLDAASYSALGGLAMVVIHSVAHAPIASDAAWSNRFRHWFPITAYAAASAATVMHVLAAIRGEVVPSRAALAVVTLVAVVFAPLLALTTSREHHGRRALWLVALTLFAVSAMHLGTGHRESESAAFELLGHHASIPLAFAILYQDYRFALADLFLKQALTLIATVAVIVAAWSLVPHGAAESVASEGLLLAFWVGTALMVPLLRRSVASFVDRFVLHRTGHQDVVERVGAALECDVEDQLLDRVCAVLAPTLSATWVRWATSDAAPQANDRVHELIVPTAEAPYYRLVVGPLAGGRRLLSGDLALLERAAFLTARRIDAIRLTDERYDRMLRDREMQALATEAELRALRAQINPHFLFNALTTIGYLVQQAPPRAFETLMRLTTLLRGVLRSEGEFTTLKHERQLVEAYLEIERARFEERLQVAIDIPDELDRFQLPPLILQPLVENAIKHGIAPARDGGRVQVSARSILDGAGAALEITVRNTGAPLDSRRLGGEGVGLRNVARRLACHFGDGACLDVRSSANGETVASLTLPDGAPALVGAGARLGAQRT